MVSLKEPTLAALNPISKSRFARIRALQHKKARMETGLTLLEGERLVAEALQSGVSMEAVLGEADFWARRSDLVHRFSAAGIPTFLAAPKQLEALAATEHPGGVLAVIPRPVWSDQEAWRRASRPDFLGVLAVGLQDPGNLGAVCRTLAAAGGAGIWLTPECAEAASPKLLRAAAGSVLRLPVVERADWKQVLARCQAGGIQTLAAIPKGGRNYTTCDWTGPTLLVLGTEGEGLNADVLAACAQKVQIPMPGGTESLNVAVAGGILLYEAVRQRRLVQGLKRGLENESTTGQNPRGQQG